MQVMVLRCCCHSCMLPLSSHVVGVMSLWYWPSVSPRRRHCVGMALAVCITSSSSCCCGCAIIIVSPWHLPWESRLCWVVVMRMLVLESSSLGSCCRCCAGAWVVVGSHGCSRWSGHRLPHDGIDQKPNSLKTIWMSPWPGTSRLKLKAGG